MSVTLTSSSIKALPFVAKLEKQNPQKILFLLIVNMGDSTISTNKWINESKTPHTVFKGHYSLLSFHDAGREVLLQH